MHTNPFIIITTRAIIDNSTSMFGKTNPSPFSYNQNTSPSYVDRSFLIYFSSAVKELNFSNKKQGIFEKNKNKQYDMDNPEFDKLFPTTRDNETSFRTLFTPLAQEEILNLIKSIGKYDFNKDGMCSTINCKEIKGKDIVVSNKYFNEYSMERIKNNFNKKFYDFFKNIYFLFAPIICIPLFSQYEFKDKLTNDKKSICGNVAAHVILNSEMNPMSLSHRQGKTKVIFEVKTISSDDDHQVDQVIAKNYKTVTTRRRVGNSTQTTTTYVPVRKQWSMKHFLTNDKTNYSELIKTIKNEYPKNKGIIKTINKVSVIY
ncbi:hypothetical protein FACS189459_6040 [Bacilli bacterium]|nr:hypothetical protein FACS189459_6040 [Bacilli bacterium]